MKAIQYVNYFLQVIWIALIALVMIIGISGVYDPGGLPILLMAIAFFMGINHLLMSIISAVVYRSKSPYNQHLLMSLFVLVLTYLISRFTDEFGIGSGTADVIYVVFGAMPPAALAIYFWVITFGKSSPFVERRHVLDL